LLLNTGISHQCDDKACDIKTLVSFSIFNYAEQKYGENLSVR